MITTSALTLPPDWHAAAAAPELRALDDFLRAESAAGHIVYPPRADLFSALTLTPFDKVRVVILGQDPYHGPGQAHGLAFSVRAGIKLPPSLKNIYKELDSSFGPRPRPHGDLTHWAQQGVLLLNTTLTVRDGAAASHQNKGWEDLTDSLIRAVNNRPGRIVFMLWGAHAQKKGALIDRAQHLILTAPHPSPLSAHRGFLGCGHFKTANDDLIARGQAPINW